MFIGVVAPEAVSAVNGAGSRGDDECPAMVLVQQSGVDLRFSVTDRVIGKSGQCCQLFRQGQYLSQ